MDYQPEMDTGTPYTNKRSESMAMASVILGIAALLTSGCIYAALICGSLGIIFALLSRGGFLTMTTQAKTGLFLSAAGLILTILFYAVMIAFVLNYYGGFDGLMQEYMNMI